MEVTIYVAIAENGLIGHNNVLPWRLSSDLKRFKVDTMGKPIVMGRKTWEGLPKRPLPERLNIVVTCNKDFRAEGAEVVYSLQDAITLATVRGRWMPGVESICVIGGGEIYRQMLPLADQLRVTHVMASPDGDTCFPEIDPNIWVIESSEDFPSYETDSHATRYTVYRRRTVKH